jgi:hypothetical protein
MKKPPLGRISDGFSYSHNNDHQKVTRTVRRDD